MIYFSVSSQDPENSLRWVFRYFLLDEETVELSDFYQIDLILSSGVEETKLLIICWGYSRSNGSLSRNTLRIVVMNQLYVDIDSNHFFVNMNNIDLSIHVYLFHYRWHSLNRLLSFPCRRALIKTIQPTTFLMGEPNSSNTVNPSKERWEPNQLPKLIITEM